MGTLASAATKAITFMAENSGVIEKLTQKAIMTGAPDYALTRIKDITYDTSKGHNPRWIRVWTAPPTRSQYQPFMPSGNSNFSVQNPQTLNDDTVSGDNQGRGCSIAADTMQYGYDVKTRCMKGRAIEVGPWCVLDLLEKEAWEQVIAQVWKDLPRYGKEQFARSLLLDVIQLAYTKYSIADGFPSATNTPYFPCVPTGGLSIGFLRQIADQILAWGYGTGSGAPMVDGRPAVQVHVGYNDKEFAIAQRKKELGMTVYTERTVDDKTFGTTTIYEGLQFVDQQMPTRGYCRQVGASAFEFVEIDPYIVVDADGEGFKPIPNPDYYQSYTTVNGSRYRILSVGYIIHPDAMVRESMGSIPSAPGGKTFPAKFDMSVRPIPDWELASRGCNKDQFFFGYRMTHAYAPRAVNPELMTAFLYVAAVPQYTITDPWGNAVSPTVVTVTPATLPNTPDSGCDPCVQPGDVIREVNEPTCSSLFPANGVGVIQFQQSAYDVSDIVSGMTIVVQRPGGNTGAASAVLTLTSGTAVQGTNWTEPTGFAGGGPYTKTLNWADGNNTPILIVVPIITAAGDDGLQFTATLGTFTGAAAGSITSSTVTIHSYT